MGSRFEPQITHPTARLPGGSDACQPASFGLKYKGGSTRSPQTKEALLNPGKAETTNVPHGPCTYVKVSEHTIRVWAKVFHNLTNKKSHQKTGISRNDTDSAGQPGLRNTTCKHKHTFLYFPKLANDYLSEPDVTFPLTDSQCQANQIRIPIQKMRSALKYLFAPVNPSADHPEDPQPKLFCHPGSLFGPVYFTKSLPKPAYKEFDLGNILLTDPLASTRKPEQLN
ncbi:hypothetical protein DSO57_1022510 [Entomophthora muscae]|uniref:Uncharacterized protein n=1 Tax=Entomophthora muscae TaxID=34485 RepID=A0ACC2S568_9FUNG|nr:hypothetical protein DSO57_1022510 [Entomophthora muscae]